MNIKFCPDCKDTTGPCFARYDGKCRILAETKPNCPFKKEDKEITNGKRYPYNPNYAGTTK